MGQSSNLGELLAPKRVVCMTALHGLSYTFTRENIADSVVWSVSALRPRFIVHLAGKIDHIEVQMRGCAVTPELPSPGELVIVPAGLEYGCLARGGVVQYAEIELQNGIEHPPMLRVRPQFGTYDHKLQMLARRFSSLTGTLGATSRIEQETLAIDIFRHLSDVYFTNAQPQTQPRHRRIRTFTDVERTVLTQYIQDQLPSNLNLGGLARLVNMTTHQPQ